MAWFTCDHSFHLEENYMRLWLNRNLTFQGFQIRFFNCSVDFQLNSKRSIIPAWIELEGLLVHLFKKGSLFFIASLVGKPLKLDEPIANLSWPSITPVCIDIDLIKEQPHRVWTITGYNKSFLQKISYENLPNYCSYCMKMGHAPNVCKKQTTTIIAHQVYVSSISE